MTSSLISALTANDNCRRVVLAPTHFVCSLHLILVSERTFARDNESLFDSLRILCEVHKANVNRYHCIHGLMQHDIEASQMNVGNCVLNSLN